MCVWWRGSLGLGRYPYTGEYPNALKSQIPGLTVLTNAGEGRPLLSPERYCGWWAKLEVFRPENRDLRPCLCVDLDTFIVGDITPILNLDPTKLWLIRQFLGTKRLGESGLFIAPKDSDYIWDAAQKLRSFDRGDGDFLRQFPHSFIPDEVDGILSYKAHRLQSGYPKGTRVVCFHGLPKPHMAGGWAQEYFEKHARPERAH